MPSTVSASSKQPGIGFGICRVKKPLPVTVTASMDGYQAKATDVSFEDGDAIGVFALDPFDRINVRGTVTGSSVTLATPFNWEKIEKAVFLGCYPYDAALKGVNLNFSVRTDQRSYEGYKASDIRSARTQASRGSTVNLVFRHRLSKLTVSAVCEDSADEVTAVTLGDLLVEATIDLAAPSVAAGSPDGDDEGRPRPDLPAGESAEVRGGLCLYGGSDHSESPDTRGNTPHLHLLRHGMGRCGRRDDLH